MHSIRCLVQFALLLAIAPTPLLATVQGCGSQESAPAAQRLGNRLHWETKSEVLSAGFDIFRSTSPEGKFIKLNSKPLPAARFSSKVRPYEYMDDSIDPCLMYYYYVEAIGEDGTHMKVSPTMASKPKLTAEPAQ